MKKPKGSLPAGLLALILAVVFLAASIPGIALAKSYSQPEIWRVTKAYVPGEEPFPLTGKAFHAASHNRISELLYIFPTRMRENEIRGAFFTILSSTLLSGDFTLRLVTLDGSGNISAVLTENTLNVNGLTPGSWIEIPEAVGKTIPANQTLAVQILQNPGTGEDLIIAFEVAVGPEFRLHLPVISR